MRNGGWESQERMKMCKKSRSGNKKQTRIELAGSAQNIVQRGFAKNLLFCTDFHQMIKGVNSFEDEVFRQSAWHSCVNRLWSK